MARGLTAFWNKPSTQGSKTGGDERRVNTSKPTKADKCGKDEEP